MSKFPFETIPLIPNTLYKPAMIIGRCICCDSNLQYPNNIFCFRCTICGSINDIRPVLIQSSVIPPKYNFIPLSLSNFENIVTICKNNDQTDVKTAWKLLEDVLIATFSSWKTLNTSFSNVFVHELLLFTSVDLFQVRTFYDVMSTLPSHLIEVLLKSINILLKRIGQPLKKPSDVLFLLIILENPFFFLYTYKNECNDIIKRTFGYISSLSNDIHHYIVNWFSNYNTDILCKKIQLCNSFISKRLSKYTREHDNQSKYTTDWGIKAATKMMALLFASNNKKSTFLLSEFYNTMVDYIDLITDFDAWERKLSKFSFCQYPFLLSMGAKINIMEYDAKRQMEVKAREAFFSSIFQKRHITPHLVLRVRRECIIEDSLRQISNNEMDLKKSLRIEFVGEDGVDIGGLRKEWFLLLCREVFDPLYGMFVWNEETNYCWFNPASFESSDQYFLVGVVLGLAIYNSTILDIHFPLACYKKLLDIPCGLDDLKVFRPSLVKGFQHLLTFEGNVEDTFCRDFVGEYEAFGNVYRLPLCKNGEKIAVTNLNREEYVKRYTSFILNTSISKQFEPFKRGFYHVCGGNALSLFRPEEIELLIRGSPESLDVDQLRSVTVYDSLNSLEINPEEESVIEWFWSIFKEMKPILQRKLLAFVTGSDRIPATGAANLSFKISILGNDCDRYPIAHTCFNQLCLYRYKTHQKLYKFLITAISDSEGFGLK
ncbi:uncharacterized protein T551_03633 [Pneumocystis jirovecii RU7]|uniref:HECT-type E3 ubiquitin transferase n=1 Tax=Pneumocystis jirovecii (strain RU7) TaxID=1408657 RepID=A0A0W4ZCF3_PNEJ7|nr:uncharacterized protein T551_03633 [Pneumocystis jirovecii RU7]KTW26061.1 hypothetical protein T551_03633 [Pneumocystis jirovecii RU7]